MVRSAERASRTMKARLGPQSVETPAYGGLLRMRGLERLWREVRLGRGLQRFLLVPALLAGEFDAALAFWRLHPVRGAALAADRLDPGIALLDDDGLLFHRFADQALGLLSQGLFGQSSSPP